LLDRRPPTLENVKLPFVTDVPVNPNAEKSTPLIVVAATPGAPMLNAPTSVPAVDTSVSAEMFVAAPHVMGVANAGVGGRAIDAATVNGLRSKNARLIVLIWASPSRSVA